MPHKTRKNFQIQFSLVRLLVLRLLPFIASNAWAFTVVIDPGHGGMDHGATHGTIVESKIALAIALKLHKKFDETLGVQAILTRSSDHLLPLKNRIKTSQSQAADLFVSLHGNSSKDRRAKGAEFYFSESRRPQSETASPTTLDGIIDDLNFKGRLYESHYFASESYRIWKESSLSRPRAIKQAPFFVINKNHAPSMLVEFGFITNDQESIELLKDDFQNQIAENIYQSILKYKNQRIATPLSVRK